MSFAVQMPALGESVTEGTVTRWLKKEGDTVAVDEPLLEVSTDKVDTEIPSPSSGILSKIIAHEDDIVPVGGDLAIISESGEESATPLTPEITVLPKEVITPVVIQEQHEKNATTTESPDTKPVTMPALGESVTEGTVTRWLKKEGDTVAVDEPLLEVSTDKVDTEIPSPSSGILSKIIAHEDDIVPVGGTLAIIGTTTPAPESAPTTTPAPESAPTTTPAPESAPTTTPAPESASLNGATPYVTPLVRKLAAEHGINLNTVVGTGVGGRIRKQDILAHLNNAHSETLSQQPVVEKASPKSLPGVKPELIALRGTTQKINRIRQITARTTRESLAGSAQLTQVHQVDLSKIVELRTHVKSAFETKYGIKLTYLPFIVKAAVEALLLHPNINASIDEEKKEITYHPSVNLGIAVDTDNGLLSPVIHTADALSLPELAQAIVDLAARARSGKLTPDEVFGGTFTVTNIGSQGALIDTPILVPPQAAMLATGAIIKRPAVITAGDGTDSIGIHSISFLPLTYDHRLIDGADAGRFVTTVRARLEQGNFESDLGL